MGLLLGWFKFKEHRHKIRLYRRSPNNTASSCKQKVQTKINNTSNQPATASTKQQHWINPVSSGNLAEALNGVQVQVGQVFARQASRQLWLGAVRASFSLLRRVWLCEGVGWRGYFSSVRCRLNSTVSSDWVVFVVVYLREGEAWNNGKIIY